MKNKGITLVALVITIIILLILAGITISQLTGSGLFENARLAEEKSKNAQEKEEGILGDYENKIGKYVDSNRDMITISEEELNQKIQNAIEENKLVQYNDIIQNDIGRLSISRVGNIVYFSGYYWLGTEINEVFEIPEKYRPAENREFCGTATGYKDSNNGFTTSGVHVNADGTIVMQHAMKYLIYNGTYSIENE